MSILSNPAIMVLVVTIIGLIVVAVLIPRFRRFLLTMTAYLVFAIALTIRFYILLPIGLMRAILYFFMGELTDIISGDSQHPIVRITRAYLPKLFLIQLQRYNGMGDQVPGFSVLALRYMVTIIFYVLLGVGYLWIKVELNFTNIIIERIFIILAIGIIINILSASLYHIISAIVQAKPKPEPEVKPPPENKLSTATLYRVNGQVDYKANDIMRIYRNAAPILAQMQRNDLTIKPFFITYKRGEEDFYQYEQSFNITEMIQIVNELPVIDETEGMIYYAIYYRNGKNFNKTEYMTRERLKILLKAVLSIYKS